MRDIGTIGLEPTSNIFLERDVTVSRLHAKIEYLKHEKKFLITALGKDSILVDGIHMQQSDPPMRLYAETYIVIGRKKGHSIFFSLAKGREKFEKEAKKNVMKQDEKQVEKQNRMDSSLPRMQCRRTILDE